MSFRHEALLYRGEDEFVARVEPVVREGAAAGEAVMVAVSDRKIGRLREALGPAGADVTFADMDDIGANPARIIHAWHEWAAPHLAARRPVRGVGEPISASRTPDELVECQRHEELLNVAFGPGPGWLLICPYDTATLEPAVIAACRCSHPVVLENGRAHESGEYRGVDAIVEPFTPSASRAGRDAGRAGVRSLAARTCAAGLPASRRARASTPSDRTTSWSRCTRSPRTASGTAEAGASCGRGAATAA